NSFTIVFDVGHVSIIATPVDLILSPSDATDEPAQLIFIGLVENVFLGFSGGFDGDPGFISIEDNQSSNYLELPEFALPFSIARSSVVPEPSTALLLPVICTVATLLRRRQQPLTA